MLTPITTSRPPLTRLPGAFAEGFWVAPLAGGDLFHATTRGDRVVLTQQAFVTVFALKAVVPFDQKPIDAPAALTVMAQTDQHPASLQLVPGQRESQLTLGKQRRCIAISDP